MVINIVAALVVGVATLNDEGSVVPHPSHAIGDPPREGDEPEHAPDHKSCYIIRSRVEGSHDLKLEGNLFMVLEAFDVAIRKGIVKQELV